MKAFTLTALTATMSIALAMSCAKKREASLPDDQIDNTFVISELKETQLTLKTSEGKSSITKNKNLLFGEKNTVLIETKDIPEKFLFMFRNLELVGKKGADLAVVFRVDRLYLTAYKIANANELTTLEKSLAISHKNSAQVLVPIFKFKIQSHGVLQSVRNELKEETSVLKLKKSEWEVSTHVQISDISHERLDIDVDPSEKGEAENFLVTEKINQKIFSKKDLSEMLSITLPGDEIAAYFVVVDLNSINIYDEKVASSSEKKAIVTLQAEQITPTLKIEKDQIENNLITFKKNTSTKLSVLTKVSKTAVNH